MAADQFATTAFAIVSTISILETAN